MTHLVAAGHLLREPDLNTDASDLALLLRLPSSARNPELLSSPYIGPGSNATFRWIEPRPESTAVGVIFDNLTVSFHLLKYVFFYTISKQTSDIN